jgi:hypothetical protein
MNYLKIAIVCFFLTGCEAQPVFCPELTVKFCPVNRG